MKKKIMGLVILILAITNINIVKGEKFVIGNYINNMYVKMVSPTKTKYLTVQFIKSTNGDITYCIEPFILLDESIEYEAIASSNINSTTNLTTQELEKIKLISFYGYGYEGRTDDIWYAITQVMIWQLVAKDSSIYFTDRLNGNETNIYNSYIEAIQNDVNRDLELPYLPTDIYVNYSDNYTYENIKPEYEVSSNYHTFERTGNKITVKNVTRTGPIYFQRINNYYDKDATFYAGSTSQKIVKRGNLKGTRYFSYIYCQEGKIKVNVISDEPIDIDNFFINFILTNNNKVNQDKQINENGTDIINLPYGDYILTINSLSEDYIPDKISYKTTIDKNNKYPTIDIIVHKRYTTLTINDYLCTNDICSNAENIKINIIDIDMNPIIELETDTNGYTKTKLTKGTYYIYQETLEDYNNTDSKQITITDEETIHVDLYNNRYIIETEEIPEIKPPNTKVNDLEITSILILISYSIIKVLKKV